MPISSHLKINGKFINHRKNAEVLNKKDFLKVFRLNNRNIELNQLAQIVHRNDRKRILILRQTNQHPIHGLSSCILH